MPSALASLNPRVETILRHFANTAPTEEAFYVRFQTLPRGHLAALKCAWGETDDWRIFRRIWRRAQGSGCASQFSRTTTTV
jgi:hypothetical protein